MADKTGEPSVIFEFLNEIGIINQLASAEFQRVLAPFGISVSEFSLLNHFVRVGDGTAPSRLARIFQMSKPSMTAIIAKLEARGLVDVGPHETDRRQKVVRLTAEGRAVRNSAIAKVQPLEADLQAGLNEKTIHQALPTLRALRRFLDERRNGTDGL